jgi:hypothetical protein
VVRLAKVITEMVEELPDEPAGGDEEGGVRMPDPLKNDRHVHAHRMADSDDPGFLYSDEERPTRLACPECNGVLAEVAMSGLRYFRCHVGHQYGPQTLEAAQREAVEAKLWAAAAALEEHAALARHLATRSDVAVGHTEAGEYRRRAERSASTATTLLSRLQRDASEPDVQPVQDRSVMLGEQP